MKIIDPAFFDFSHFLDLKKKIWKKMSVGMGTGIGWGDLLLTADLWCLATMEVETELDMVLVVRSPVLVLVVAALW